MKRQAEIQLNNVTSNADDEEEESLFKQADKQEIKRREIKTPKSRIRQFNPGTGSGVPRSSGLSTATSINTTNNENIAKADSLAEFARKLRSLNKSFVKKIVSVVENNEIVDISALCTQYIKYRLEIKTPEKPKPTALGASTATNTMPTTNKPLSSSNFQFGTSAASNSVGSLPSPGSDVQSIASKAPTTISPPLLSTPVQPSSGSFASAKPSFGSSNNETTKKVEELQTNFKFGAVQDLEQPIKPFSPFQAPESNKKQFGFQKPGESSLPLFQFGSAATKPAEEASKSTFQFATFTKQAVEESAKPNFQFGNTPKSNEEPAKPAFQFGGMIPKATVPATKPNFQFGSIEKPSSLETSEPNREVKQLNPAAKPFEFTSGKAAPPMTSVTGFTFGKTESTTPDTGFTFGKTESAPSMLPKPSGISFGSSSNFGKSTESTTTFGTSSGVPVTFNFGTPAADVKKPVVSFGLQNLSTPAPLSTGFSFQPQAAPPAEEVGEEDAMPELPQVDLSKGVGEENDTILFEVKAKIFTKNEEKAWVTYGLGILKVSKTEENTIRLICRSDTGKLLVNSRLFKNMGVTAVGKADCSLLLQIDDRVQPCLVRVKTPQSRDDFVKTLISSIADLK